MFVLLGDTPEKAAEEAKNVLAIETALAQGSMSRVDRRTPANVYHIMTIDRVAGADSELRLEGLSWPRRRRAASSR